MGQDALIKALEEESGKEAERIIKEAEAEAGTLLREAEEAAERERRERLEGFKKELEKKRAAAINRADANARGLLLAEKTRILEDIFTEARRTVEGLPKGRYAELVKGLYEELEKDWATERPDNKNGPIVHLNPADLDLLKEAGVEFVGDEAISLGLVFVSRDGRVRLENTFSSRLKRARTAILPRLKEMLFG